MPPDLVAIGAGADRTEDMQSLLRRMSARPDIAVVIVLHKRNLFELEDLLATVRSSSTDLQVAVIDEPKDIREGHIYIANPGSHVSISNGRVVPINRASRSKSAENQFDFLLKSLAIEYREKAKAILLPVANPENGASDGAEGCRAIKKLGGRIYVQAPTDTESRKTPEAVVTEKLADFIGTTDEIAEEIFQDMGNRPFGVFTEADRKWFVQKILDDTDQNFCEYNASTIVHRIEHRMAARGISELRDYMALVRDDKKEVEVLRDSFLIKVTKFNRDPIAFQHLDEQVLANISNEAPPLTDDEIDDDFRVWVAGCCTGQEAYTIAFYLMDRLERCTHPRRKSKFLPRI